MCLWSCVMVDLMVREEIPQLRYECAGSVYPLSPYPFFILPCRSWSIGNHRLQARTRVLAVITPFGESQLLIWFFLSFQPPLQASLALPLFICSSPPLFRPCSLAPALRSLIAASAFCPLVGVWFLRVFCEVGVVFEVNLECRSWSCCYCRLRARNHVPFRWFVVLLVLFGAPCDSRMSCVRSWMTQSPALKVHESSVRITLSASADQPCTSQSPSRGSWFRHLQKDCVSWRGKICGQPLVSWFWSRAPWSYPEDALSPSHSHHTRGLLIALRRFPVFPASTTQTAPARALIWETIPNHSSFLRFQGRRRWAGMQDYHDCNNAETFLRRLPARLIEILSIFSGIWLVRCWSTMHDCVAPAP